MTTESTAGQPQPVTDPYTDAPQQRRAVMLGMWVFLATEVLFFGGPLMVYAADRIVLGAKFVAGSSRLDLVLGTTNSALLLISSFVMILAVAASLAGRTRRAALLFVVTAILGTVFLAIKGFEWHHVVSEGLWPNGAFAWTEADPGPARLFFTLYFALTGLHAIHLAIGIAAALFFAVTLHWRRPFVPDQNAVALFGLYWHFVDIVWLFLFPLLYLAHRHA